MSQENHNPYVCIAGAALDTGNLGVSALCHSIVDGLDKHGIRDSVIFDHGKGLRDRRIDFEDRVIEAKNWGLVNSRRYYRPESIANMMVAAKWGLIRNQGVQIIRRAAGVLDISGGDSFTDLYLSKRFAAILAPKRLALTTRRPLYLLPQTYGPFNDERSEFQARTILSSADMVWSRDEDGYKALQLLLGDEFNPTRHRLGVDVAFGLRPVTPRKALSPALGSWLAPETEVPLIGINVSGLTFNDTNRSTNQFGLKADYREVISEFVRRILGHSSARIVLVPHVHKDGLPFESDQSACHGLIDLIPPAYADRVAIAPTFSSPGEVKWLISKFDWFCGTRMHSTIAALSSGVPAAALAYSLKTRGVFKTCGQEREVHDLRQLDSRSVVDALFHSWQGREAAKSRLRRHLPLVLDQSRSQMSEICDRINETMNHRGELSCQTSAA